MSKWKAVIFGLFKCCLPFPGNHGEAHEFFRFAQEYTEIRESISKNYSLADNFVTAKNIFDSRCFFRS